MSISRVTVPPNLVADFKFDLGVFCFGPETLDSISVVPDSIGEVPERLWAEYHFVSEK